jgi:hypothetical protein
MNIIFIFPFIYITAFLLLFLLPSWKLLIPVGIITFAALYWCFQDVSNGDGPGVIVAGFVLILIGVALISGFIGRAILFVTRQWLKKSVETTTIGVITFFLVPFIAFGIFYINIQIESARNAPPPESCLLKLHTVTLADIKFALPILPVIRVGEGKEFSPSYSLQRNEGSRIFCDHAKNNIPKLTNIYVDFESAHYERTNSQFCKNTQSQHPWWKRLCNPEQIDKLNFPVTLLLYELNNYNVSNHGYFEDKYKKIISSSQFSQSKIEEFEVFSSEKYQQQYWLTTHQLWTKDKNIPYFADCHSKLNNPKMLYCITGYHATDKLGVVYSFETEISDFRNQSLKIAERVNTMISDLQAHNP